MECFNAAIALKLNYKGVRMDPKSKKVMHKHNPAKPIWRELDTHENKVKVAYQATNLFKGGLTNFGSWDKNLSRAESACMGI